MNITLTTKEIVALKKINSFTSYKTDGVYTQAGSKSIPKNCLQSLERAGLIQVATVTNSNWGTSRGFKRFNVEIHARITDFGREQLRMHGGSIVR